VADCAESGEEGVFHYGVRWCSSVSREEVGACLDERVHWIYPMTGCYER
jgi:hypothetical protein